MGHGGSGRPARQAVCQEEGECQQADVAQQRDAQGTGVCPRQGAGPEGGEEGGYVVATGTPEQVAAVSGSHTGHFLSAFVGLGAAAAAA